MTSNISNILSKYTMADLKRLRVYLIEFQDCDLNTPPTNQKKKDWLDTAVDIVSKINFGESETEPQDYISRIMSYIRWFATHYIRFNIGMKTHFFNHIKQKFVYEVTDTIIKIVDENRSEIEIQKRDMILPQKTLDYINRTPSTLNRRYFFLDDIAAARERRRLEQERIAQEVVMVRTRPFISAENIPIPEHFDPNSTEYHPWLHWDRYFDSPFPDFAAIRAERPPGERLVRLGQLNHFITSDPEDEEATEETKVLECRICLTNKVRFVLVDCGHAFCGTCLIRLSDKHCPVCRSYYIQKLRLYL